MWGRIQNSFSDQISRFFHHFFSKIVVNPIPWRKLKWWHFRQKKWIQFLIHFRIFVHLFFRKSEWIPSPGENQSDGIFAKRSEFIFWPIFAVSFTIFFENPSESHPLAKIEVTALSPKEVKSSDFDQSGTIQMMKHNGRRKFHFLLLAMMFKLAINNDRIHI